MADGTCCLVAPLTLVRTEGPPDAMSSYLRKTAPIAFCQYHYLHNDNKKGKKGKFDSLRVHERTSNLRFGGTEFFPHYFSLGITFV